MAVVSVPVAVQAATINVTAGAVDNTVNGNCSLIEAIQSANTDAAVDACTAGSGFDIIIVPAGTYTLTAAFGNAADGNPVGLPPITSAVRIDGASAASTIIERSIAMGTPAFRLFDVSGSGELGLRFLTVRNGLSPNGAAVRYASLSPIPAFLSQAVFDNNVATSGGGGAINFTSPFPPPPPGMPAITLTTFSSNSAADDGGAIRVASGANVVIETSTFSSNTAVNGGAITNGDFAGGVLGTVTCTRCFFSGNSATLGGAIFSRGALTLTDSRFSANSASSNGGALNLANVNGGSPSVTIAGVTFDGNSSDGDVGAARLGELTGGSIVNSTFSGNAAVADVGALVINDNTGPVTVNNVTFTGNTAGGAGGAVQIDSPDDSVALANTIVAANTAAGSAPDCVIIDPGTMFSSQGFNLIGDGSSCNFVAVSSDQVGSGGAPINPLLGALANNGGPTAGATATAILTHFPQPGSPVLDAGNSVAPGGAFPACAADDQIDVARPVGPRCDIGAIESIASADLAVTKTDSVDPVNVGDNITYTITVINNGPNTASGVTLTDTLPASVNFVSASPSQGTCAQAAGVVTCNLGALANGSSATVSIVAATTTNALITNTATVTADGTDTNPANNQASQSTAVGQMADLILSMTEGTDPVPVSTNLVYTLTVANAGPDQATGVMLVDTLPANTTFQSASIGTGSCAHAMGVVTCNIGNIAAAASVTATITIQATMVGSITNMANVTLAEFDPDTSNNSASVPTGVVDFAISVAPASVTVTLGNSGSYTVTLMPVGGRFDNSVGLSCTSPPTGVTCNFNPSSPAPGGATITSTMTVRTTVGSSGAAPFQPPQAPPPTFIWLVVAAALLGWLMARRVPALRGHLATLGIALALLLMLGLQVGCSSTTDTTPPVVIPGTPRGTHTITVRGNFGSLEHSATTMLVVQ